MDTGAAIQDDEDTVAALQILLEEEVDPNLDGAETVLDVDIVLVETVLGVEETDHVAEGIVLETVETFLDVDQIVHSLPDLCTDHSDQETEVLTFSNSVYHCNWCSCCQSSLSSTFYSVQCLYPSL